MPSNLPALALLHPVARLSWREFSVHWSTVIGLLALLALYEWRAHATRAESAGNDAAPRLRARDRALFVSGLVLIFLSLNGPLHDLSDTYLFSGHMVQHLLLTLVVPPLLLMGTPGWMFRPALEIGWVNSLARNITGARVAFVIFNVVVAMWHLPPMYNTAMAYHAVHIAQHLMFMVSATIMWWPLLSPLPELPRLSYPGGLISWIPGGFFFYIVLSVIFFGWQASGADDRAGAQVGLKPAPR